MHAILHHFFPPVLQFWFLRTLAATTVLHHEVE